MQAAVLLLICTVAISNANIDGFYSNGCPRDHSIEAYLPHENCNQFYQCVNGALITRICPTGLNFNSDMEKCDWNGETKCQRKREGKKIKKNTKSYEELDHSNPKHVRVICSKFQSNGEVVAHENCNQFYKCSQGEPIVHRCAPSLMYNTVNEKCDWASNVDCSDRILPDYDSILNKRDANDDSKNNNSESEELDSGNNDPNQALRLCSSPGSDGVLVAHENCYQFFKCFSGSPVAMSCPDGLFYNPVKAYCDWPQNVYCGERATPGSDDSVENDVTATTPINSNGEGEKVTADMSEEETNVQETVHSDPSQAPAICKAENSNGVLVANENCRRFYKCSGGIPVELSCPGVLLYHIAKGYCDWPNNVDCGERFIEDKDDENNNEPVTEPESNHDNANDAPSICAALGSDGILVAHEKCNQFYKCHEGLPVALKCPSNLMYNINKQYCDWPSNVECGDRIIPEVEEIDSEDTTDGETSSEEAAGGAHNDPSEAPVICAAAESNGILIAHENCNQFYKCFEGKPVALFCPLDLLYNPAKEYCDWPHNVYCDDRFVAQDKETDNNSNENTDEVKVTCSQRTDGDVIPHENCSQFYKCLSEKGYPMDCPPGLYFNAILKVCDWPLNVQCGNRLAEAQALTNPKQISRRARSHRS